MEKINAIDLDKTLIPFDSFRVLIISYFKKKKIISLVGFYTLLRKIRLIGSGEFKHRVLEILKKDQHYNELIQDLVSKVMVAIKPDVLDIIDRETYPDTINVLISASPADYVGLVAEKLNWRFLASEIINGKFIHCYGQNKIELLKRHYSEEKFVYNFAISDSPSDITLLHIFKKHIFVSKKCPIVK